MADDYRFLWWWTAAELALVGWVTALIVGSFLGWTTLFRSMAPSIRLVLLAGLTVELLIPLWVFIDLRRRGIHGSFWVHVAAMPGVNLVGLAAYLERRMLDAES